MLCTLCRICCLVVVPKGYRQVEHSLSKAELCSFRGRRLLNYGLQQLIVPQEVCRVGNRRFFPPRPHEFCFCQQIMLSFLTKPGFFSVLGLALGALHTASPISGPLQPLRFTYSSRHSVCGQRRSLLSGAACSRPPECLMGALPARLCAVWNLPLPFS